MVQIEHNVFYVTGGASGLGLATGRSIDRGMRRHAS